MQQASSDLSLDHLWVIYPGEKRYLLSEQVTALPMQEIDSIK
jgi:hypothetical protein